MRPLDGQESGPPASARAERRAEAAENAPPEDPAAPFGLAGLTPTLDLQDPIPGDTFINKLDPPMAFAIKPILPRGEVIEVNGGHGRLKSTLVLSWCLSVATGREWGSYSPSMGKACFISMEDRERVLRARVQAWIGGLPEPERKQAWKDLEKNFSCLTREQARGYSITIMERGRIIPVLRVIDKLKMIAKDKILLVLETTARLHEGDEDNAGLLAFGLAIEEVATETGATIVIIRHQSKSDARAQTSDSYSGRGGGALADAARGVFVITRPDVADPKDRALRPIVVHHAKTTIGEPVPVSYWKPEVVKLPNGDVPVFLRNMTKREIAGEVGAKVLERIAESFPEGIGRDDLVKSFPAAERGDVRGQVDILVKAGKIIEATIQNGKKGRPSRFYRLPEWEIGSVIELGNGS